MAYKDEEEKRRKAQERKAAGLQYQEKRDELIKKNAELNASKKAAPKPSATAMASGKSKTSMTAEKVSTSVAGYAKKKEGDNDMSRVVAGYNKEKPDINNMTYEQAMGFATRIVYDDERDAFLSRWQKSTKKKNGSAPTMDEMRTYLNSQKPGGLYRESKDSYSKQVKENFKNDYTNIKTMHAFDGLLDISGNAVNMNTAALADIERAIRFTANDKKRKAMVAALETLTKTPGNRFYGVTFDKSNTGKFLESSELTNEDYNDEMEYFRGQFDPIAGAGESNSAVYQELLKGIEESDNSDYVKRQFKDALDEVYTELIGGEIPKPQASNAPQELQEAEEAPQKAAQEDKADWLSKALSWGKEALDGFRENKAILTAGEFQFAKQMDKPEEIKTGEWQGPKQRKAPTLQDALADEEFMRSFIETKMAEAEAEGISVGEWQGPQFKDLLERSIEDEEFQTHYAQYLEDKNKPKEVQGPAKKTPPTMRDAAEEGWETPEKQGPMHQAQAGKTHTLADAAADAEFAAAYEQQQTDAAKEEEIPYGSIDEKNNPVRAWMYARNGEGNLLTKETIDMVNELVASSPAAKAISGLDATGSMELYAQAEAGDPFALAKANKARREYLTGGYVSVLGSTLSHYLDMAHSDTWPEDLRDDMEGVVLQVGLAAEEAYRNGEFTYDPDKETLYDAYLKVKPEAANPLENAEKAVNAMREAQKEKDRLAAEDAAKNAQELLRQHQEQVESGDFTQEAYDHVLLEAPEVTTLNAQNDATYRSMLSEIRTDRTLADGMEDSWHNQMAERYLRENGLPDDLDSVAAMQYKDMLAAFEEDVLLSDMRIAKALGYNTLEEMYSKWGGMDVDKLHGRAEAAMHQLANSVTAEDLATIEQSASAYMGTEDASGYYIGAAAKGLEHGAYSATADMLEAVWAFSTISLEGRADAVAHNRHKFVEKYGYALAPYMYTQAAYKYAENAPSKEQGDAIKAYLDTGNDPFQLGIDPTASDVVMDAANAMDVRAQAVSDWAHKTLNAKQGKWFERSSGIGSTLTMQLAATTASIVTGNSFVGNYLGYGLPSAAEEMRVQLGNGATRKEAMAMGFMHGATDTLANMASSEKFFEKIRGFVGYSPLVNLGAKNAGNVGTARVMLGTTKAMAKGAISQLADEVVDTFKEEAFWQFGGAAMQARLDGASILQSVVRGYTNINVVEAAETMVEQAPETIIQTLPLAFLGGLGEGFKASRAMATKLAATGDADSAVEFYNALNIDLEKPENREELNKALHDAAVGEEAAVIAMTDDENGGSDIDIGAKAQEQADAHAKSEENSMVAAEAGLASALAAQENLINKRGDPKENVTQIGNGVAAHTKNSQSTIEHRREKEQKQAEADAAFAEGMKKATAKAEAEVSAREEAIANPPQEQVDPAHNARVMEVNQYVEENFPNGVDDEQWQAIYDEFEAGDLVANESVEESPEPTPTPKLEKANVEFASQIARKYGYEIAWDSNLEYGAEGKHIGGERKIVLNPNATQGEIIKRVLVHELTHGAEGTEAYADLENALIDFKYGGDTDQFMADVNSKRNTYRNALRREFSEPEAKAEMVADICAELISGNDEMLNRLVAEKPSVARRILDAIKDFINKLRGVRDPEMDNLKRIEGLLEKALDQNNGERGEQYMLVDVGEMGKGIYESNFPEDTPKDVKRQRTIDLWQSVWSQQPIELTIIENGNPRQITANFDPDYDPENIRRTDLGKMMHSKNGSGGDRSVTLNLADDLYDIARTSDYHSSEAEQGKLGATHEGVKIWHYFFKDIIYRNGGKDTPYTVWMDVKEKNDGGYVYQLYARKTKEKTTQSQSGEIGPGDLSASSSTDTSVPENTHGVNPRYTQNAKQYSLPQKSYLRDEISAWRKAKRAEAQREADNRKGERQFVSKTLQNSRAIPSYIRQTLFNDPTSRFYDRDSNDEQIIRAYQTIAQEGKEAAIERILTSHEMPTKDEIAQANVLMAQAAHDGDMSTLLALSRHYAEDTTEVAQALQAMKIFKRMTPAGAMSAAAAQNEALLSGYIEGHTPVRQEVEAEARRVSEDIEGKDSRDPIALLGSGEMTLTRENSKWGIPINERQEALIKHYKLESVTRPGIHYNRATVKQRMLEAILATPDPLEATNEGMTLVTRLEYMKKGAPVITNADLEYIGRQLAIYASMDADSQDAREGQLALARAYEANANITQAGAFEKINGARFINMLLNLTSPTRNVMGNVLQTSVNSLSNVVANILDAGVSLATKERTKAMITPKEAVEGWEAFAQETMDTYRDYFVDKAVVKQGEGRFDVNRRGRIYQGEAAETARITESFLMSVGDRNFWKMAYVNSMNEQMRVAKKNGVELDYEAARARAEQEANYATFNEDNKVRDAMNALKNAGIIGKGIDLLMPFTGVPTNIVKRQLEYGPVGLAYTSIKHAARAAKKENFDQKAFVEELARGLTGTGLMALGFGLKQLGMITGGTSEEEDTAAYYMRTARGEQYTPFIKVGDQYVSLSTFAPAVSPILMGATAYDAWKNDENLLQAFASATAASLDSIIDASYFSAIQDILTGDGTFAENLEQTLLTSIATQSTPSLMSQMASSMDPYVRDTKDKNWMKQTLNKAIARVPILRETLPVKYDVTGEAVKNTKEGWRAFLDPFTTTEAENDKAVDELLALYKRTGDASGLTGYLISSNSYKLSVTQKAAKKAGAGTEGYSMELTTEQKQAINQKYADILFNGDDGIRKLIESRRWQTLSDEERVEEIADLRSEAKLEATVWAIRQYGKKE